MTTSTYVTGYELRQAVTQRMAGSGTTTERYPHAVEAGHTDADLPVTAVCGAPVDELSSTPWPPGQRLNSMRPPCLECAV